MGDYNIKNTGMSNMENAIEDYSIPILNPDSPQDQDESVWDVKDGALYWSYFNKISDLKIAICMKAIWNVGKGYTADIETKTLLENMKGWGKDTFKDILFNLEVSRRIFGDAFAEIIRDEKGRLVNLKVLNSINMRIVVDREGMIKRYEQRIQGQAVKKYKPYEIFHMSNLRLIDQIHGISEILALKDNIDADEEVSADLRKFMHRQARPMIMFKINTQNRADRDAFIAVMDEALSKGENVYIPEDKNTVSYEVIQVNASNVILEYKNHLRNKFYRGLGMPISIFANGGQTESGSKIEYLGHENVFEWSQTEWEEQLRAQLGITINLISPVSLLENLQTDESKDADQGMNMQGNDFNPAGDR
jgi:hypothetical protein